MECPATPPDIADCALLRTPSPATRVENNEVKNESVPEPNSRAENSGTNDADSSRKQDERCKSPDPTCSICLGQIENMAYTDSCFHKFCFTCLLEWSKVRLNEIVKHSKKNLSLPYKSLCILHSTYTIYFRFDQCAHYAKQDSSQLFILFNQTMFMKVIHYLHHLPLIVITLQDKKWHW